MTRARKHGSGQRQPRLAQPDRGLLQQAGFSGQDMDLPHRDTMEEQFGVDLGEVHAMFGNQAAMEALQAQAFATGDVAAFDSASPPEEQVAHEVAHLLQQGRGQGQGLSEPGSGAERAAASGQALGTGADASLHRDGTEEAGEGGQELAEITVRDGTRYTVKEEDLSPAQDQGWDRIARKHGMMARDLTRFNQQVQDVSEGGTEAPEPSTPTLVAGLELYIPSSDELAFAACRERAGSYEAAVQLYGSLAKASNLKILEAARFRASGRRGEGYGNLGVDGREGAAGSFLSPNPDLVGASRKRSEVLDGQREYRINWNATSSGFWKCSVFLHDTLFEAGYQPHLTGNDHYQLAGQLHESDKVTEIPVEQAAPGALWQRFGGRGADESHNAILTSFVTITEIDETSEQWSFTILGAEQEGAGESERSHTMKKGTNETLDGMCIRFFKPAGT